MKIFKIEVDNFRLLKAFSMDLEQGLSLIIGKNNTGKTSILSVMEKFLGSSDKNKFSFDDFSIEFKKHLKKIITGAKPISENNYAPSGIKLKVYIEYNEHDDLSNISRVMMDLDPANNIVVLGFEYTLHFNDYVKIRKDYSEFSKEEVKKRAKQKAYTPKKLYDFLQRHQLSYFKLQKKSFEYNRRSKRINESNYIDLIDGKIKIDDIINFKFISAKRDVTNKDIDKTLSRQTSRIYKRTEVNEEQRKEVDIFQDTLTVTDDSLTTIYSTLFNDVVEKVRSFGGIKLNESEIKIVSTLQHRELLEGNTTVVYSHDEDHKLPEHYNGLGYMNLISMIFEIEILLQDFKRKQGEKLADINLLFIEEPEAHTHPQMQYVFIKNIKKLLGEGINRIDKEHRDLQYIISTHSACIVADSDFDDIKYLKKEDNNNVLAKNLKDLKDGYAKDPKQYQFLKQYLTISRAEIFFADKAILIEGDTERILIPTMMKQIDLEEEKRFSDLGEKDPLLPLLSQNISIIEVGAYSQIFERFIDFIGIKSIIVTDLDAIDNSGEKCEVSAGVGYSNGAISFFFNDANLNDLKGYNLSQKLFSKVKDKWKKDAKGKLCVVYQVAEQGYNARSFEDAFIHINHDFVKNKKDDFRGLKNREYFDDPTKKSYFLADNCIKKKTHFALDIVYHSNSKLSNWKTPQYIKEGLLWLKQD
ncbi:ATP-dependent endonuclease [Fluviicola sp.]|uniref:ATP-dependent nuclease n=1 Tax=Fluviicola sp. TaxID=1917219 RepID=UPI0031CE58FF